MARRKLDGAVVDVQTSARAKIDDGDKITVITLVVSTDFLPPGARPPAGPVLTGKRAVHAIAVGGYAVIPLPNGAEPRIAGVLGAEDEGVVWCRGWEGDVVNAMRTVNAIRDLE